MRTRTRRPVIGAAIALTMALTGCANSTSEGSSGQLNVVAAENFWGSIAAQLGGNRVHVTNIIDNPNADPHDYEPTADDAKSMATAQFVIENGVGYDPWAQRLLDANPVSGRVVLNVGTLVGEPVGGNPHRWYSPDNVQQVIAAITKEYKKLDPPGASYFDQQTLVLRDERIGGVPRRHLRDPHEVRRHAGRRIGEHLRAAWRPRSV